MPKNLWGGTTGPQLMGFVQGQQQLQLQKQREEREKKRLDFLQNLETQQIQLQRRELDLAESQAKIKNAIDKAEMEGTIQFQKGIQDIMQPTGRRAMGPTGPIPPQQRMAQKAFQLGAHAMKYGQPVPGVIGQMAKGTEEKKDYFNEWKLIFKGDEKKAESMRASKPPDALLTTIFKPPEEKKPGEDYHWDNGGLWSWKEMRWIILPKDTNEIVTSDDILNTYKVLEQMGVVDDYTIHSWFSHWIKFWGPSKEERTKEVNELIKNIVGGRPVSPELNALFPDLGFNVGKTARDVTPKIRPQPSSKTTQPTKPPGIPQPVGFLSPSAVTTTGRGTTTTMPFLNPDKQAFIQYQINVEGKSPQKARKDADAIYGK